jgi:hypothetical protein
MTEQNLQLANDIDLDSFVSIKSVSEFIEHLKRCVVSKEHFDLAKEFETFNFDWLT